MSPLTSPIVQSLVTRSVDSRSLKSNSNIQKKYISHSHRPHRTLSTGWKIGIVIIILFVVGASSLFLWYYKRKRRMRQERMAQINAEAKYDASQIPGLPPQATSSPPTYGQPSELAGQDLPPRYEAPDTPMAPREVPNNEVPRKPHEAHLVQRSELPV
ncbi:hypothetical protein F4811DRAFT_461929 [Daldinia bambusicola]|nr:hypothetical protein F4811DRAFT_461929 [Daldinia bambusicola]